MFSHKRSHWARRALVVLLAASLTAPVIASPATGQQTNACPAAVPVSELTDASRGIGWTVADGRTREQFSWEFLGVLEDALGPGRDLIIVDTSGSAVEEQGVFYGMSGSPLFLGDRFVGAIAYGLAGGPSTVAGVTPAEDMLRVLRYPIATDDDDDSSTARYSRSRRLSWRMRSKIAAKTSMSAQQVGSGFTQLRLPMAVSGVAGPGFDSIAEVIREERLPLVPYQGSSAGQTQTTGAIPQPGDNLSAVLSYGDVTFAATGTLTLACEDKFVAFGHPFFWEGETTFAGHAAETIAVIEDPIWGSYELANIAEPVSRIDQDRLAGLRGIVGSVTDTVPITSTVSSTDTGLSRDGQTTVVDQEPVPYLAFYHLYSNILVTMDEYSEGSSTGTFTITGVTDDGDTWDLTRTNMYSSEYGIAYSSSFEVESFLHTLLYNDFEDVEFTGVDMTFTAQEEELEYRISDVLVSTDGDRFRDKRRIRAAPGSTVYLRVLLSESEDDPEIPVDLAVEIPRRTRRDTTIEISRPNFYDSEICFYEPEECVTATGDKVETLEQLIEVLEARPTNNLLRAQIRRGRGKVVASDEELMDRVISGRARVRVLIGCCAEDGGKVLTD